MDTNSNNQNQSNRHATVFVQTFLHGTKADLTIGDFIEVGFKSNYGKQIPATYVFMTATLDAAIWGAELASGNGKQRIYVVEATGAIENDPDVTDKKFPGNPTMSYRSKQPLRVIGEITIWQGHDPEQVKSMQTALRDLKERGVHSLNDKLD